MKAEFIILILIQNAVILYLRGQSPLCGGSFRVTADQVPSNCDTGIVVLIDIGTSLEYITEADDAWAGGTEEIYISSPAPGNYLLIVAPVDHTSLNLNETCRIEFRVTAAY